VRFLKGDRRPPSVPPWDLSMVLGALRGPSFAPFQLVDLKPLSLKTALLLALVSIKRVGDLQALSVRPACLEFGPDDSKVILKPRHGYVPKAYNVTTCALHNHIHIYKKIHPHLALGGCSFRTLMVRH